MRVLLLVQNDGDKRPVCIPGHIGHDPAEMPNYSHWFKDTGFYMNWRPYSVAYDADRWWLVECENAEAGRAAIECYEGSTGCTSGRVFGFDHCRSGRHPGSILASGGKR